MESLQETLFDLSCPPTQLLLSLYALPIMVPTTQHIATVSLFYPH